jgi:signal transduction histidine kinase
MRLWVKLFLLNVLLVLCMGTLVGLAIRDVIIGSLRDELSRQGVSIARNFADRITVSVLLEDRYDIEEAGRELMDTEKDIEYIFVTDQSGKIIFHTFANGYPPNLLTWNPVGADQTPGIQLLATEHGLIRDIGIRFFPEMAPQLHLGLNETRLTRTLARLRTMIIAIMVAVTSVGFVLSFVLSKHVTRHLAALAEFTHSLSRGAFGQQVEVHARDEVGELAATFNTLSRGLKASREKMEETYRQMLQAEKQTALGRLSAGLAHEIRNPLTSIKALFQALRTEPELRREDIEMVLAAVNQMDDLVAKFLGFARSDNFHSNDIYANAILKQILQLVHFQLKNQQIELVLELEKLSPVKGDDDMIRQALLNLVMNAIEAMPSRGRLTLASRVVDGQVEISVKDTGAGIPETIKDKIFDPFFTTKPEGTGLGLGIVYNIAQLHNGTVIFVSNDDGTTFTLKLPLQA